MGIPVSELIPRMGLTNDRFESFLIKAAAKHQAVSRTVEEHVVDRPGYEGFDI